MFTITRGQGFWMDLPNGWTVSVQWGIGNYCQVGRSSHDSDAPMKSGDWSSTTAEIASWRTNARDTEVWYDFGGDTVRGHQTTGEVMEFINMIADLPNKPQPVASMRVS